MGRKLTQYTTLNENYGSLGYFCRNENFFYYSEMIFFCYKNYLFLLSAKWMFISDVECIKNWKHH